MPFPFKVVRFEGLPEPPPDARRTEHYRLMSSDSKNAIDLSFVSEQEVARCAELLTGALLGTGEGQYSPAQVRRALWEFYKHEESRLLEDLVPLFLDWTDTTRRFHWLGEPEITQDKEDG